jgi:transcriptional regulator with PAS, ATPase and Fis domain
VLITASGRQPFSQVKIKGRIMNYAEAFAGTAAREMARSREKTARRLGDDRIIDSSSLIQKVLALAGLAAEDKFASVLLLGESGTGKGLIAEEIHRASPRSSGPFITLNCGASNPNLIEAELFGHEKGAFTGCVSRKQGVFEQAHTGTLFLDEIGDLPLYLQVKLLRVLDKRVVKHLGGRDEIHVDLRLISATNKDLEAAVNNKEFRADLYYRLSVINITIAPLRERPEDILPLAMHFLGKCAERRGSPGGGITAHAKDVLQSYAWPGNVRELANAIEHAVVVAAHNSIGYESLPDHLKNGTPTESIGSNAGGASAMGRSQFAPTRQRIGQPARARIEAEMTRSNGNVSQSAASLGLSREQLYRRLIYHQIPAQSFR